MQAPAIDGIDEAADFGMYFLNAESYVVVDDIEMTSTSDAELDSSSAIAWFVVAFDAGLVDDRFESGSMILAIENFNGKVVRGCCGCWANEFDGETVMIDGEDKGDAAVLFAAVSIIGLFDVSGTPDGLRGCIPDEIYGQTNERINQYAVEIKLMLFLLFFAKWLFKNRNKGLNA